MNHLSNLNRTGSAKACLVIVTGALLVVLSASSGCSLWTVNSALSQLCDGDCAANEVCVNGRCAVATTPVDILPTCVEDSDCGVGEQCLNDECVDREACVNGTCSGSLVCGLDGFCEEPTPCAVDTECDDGVACNGAELCNLASGLCESGITTCGGEAPYCDVDADICVQCVGDANCDNGLFCDGAEFCDSIGTCIDVAAPCQFGCDDEFDFCSQCEVRTDCPEDSCAVDCNDGICSAPNEPCPALCDFPDGENGDRRCIECKDNFDCEDGLRCDGTQTCDLSSDTCVTTEGTAAPCEADDEKPQCKEVDADGGLGFECINCTDDADCDDLFFCNGTERCGEDGLCVDEFDDDNDHVCMNEDVLRRCSEDRGECVLCLSDSQCGDGDLCSVDRCIDNMECNRDESVCDDDTDVCVEVGVQIGFFIVTKAGCGECDENSDCPPSNSFCGGEARCLASNRFSNPVTLSCGFSDPCPNTRYCDNEDGCLNCRVNSDCDNDNDACNGVTTCNSIGNCVTSNAVSCTLPEVCNPNNGQCAAP